MRPRSNWRIVRSDKGAVVIRDLGPGDEYLSVTNDAEAVVKELYDEGLLPTGRQLLYYDSAGRLDEIRHDGKGTFTGFKAGPPDETPDEWGF